MSRMNGLLVPAVAAAALIAGAAMTPALADGFNFGVTIGDPPPPGYGHYGPDRFGPRDWHHYRHDDDRGWHYGMMPPPPPRQVCRTVWRNQTLYDRFGHPVDVRRVPMERCEWLR